jgi:MFS family permease
MEWAGRLGPLGERRFRLLFVGQAASVFGDALVPVALSFAVLELTGSATDLGFVLAAHVLPLVGLVLVGGVWADRLPRQLVMLGSDCVRGVTQAVLAVLLLTDAAELWHLIVLAAVYGAAEAFFQPAATGLVPSTVGPARLQQANALLGLSRSTGFIVGPALAGVIVAASNPGVAFAVDAGTFAVSVLSLAFLRTGPVARAERQSFVAELAGGWQEFASRTWLWVIIAWAATYLFFVHAPFHVLGPLIAKESLGGPTAWGLIAAAFAVGELCGGAWALRWKPERPILVCTLLVFLELPAVVLLALREPALAIAAAHLAGGIGMGFFTAVWATTLQQHIPPDRLSRVSAYDWMGSLAFFPLGFALAGPVADAIGVSKTLWISAAWIVVSTLATLAVPSVRELRRREGVPALVPEVAPASGRSLDVARGG